MKQIYSLEELLQTPVWKMTGEQLAFLMSNLSLLTDKSTNQKEAEAKPKNRVFGIKGIASIFGCSVPTANRIKRSGIIDDAISQHKRTIVVDVDKALELAAKAKKNGKEDVA